MSRRVIIDTPFPTVADIARALGVPLSEAKRVERLVSESKSAKRPRANGHVKHGRKKASNR